MQINDEENVLFIANMADDINDIDTDLAYVDFYDDEADESGSVLAGKDEKDGGIGTYNESSLHASLKSHYEPDKRYHEVKYKGYIADIKNEQGIIEIQTGNFKAICEKIKTFTEEEKVTVVYPCVRKKWVIWFDPLDGELSKKHRHNRTGTRYDAFEELYQIRNLLLLENLTVTILMIDIEDYRRLNIKGKNRKRGSVRYDRVPVEFGEEYRIAVQSDLKVFIPEGLGIEFTVKDFSTAAKIDRYLANTVVNTLEAAGAVELCGNRDKSRLFKVMI